MPLVECEGEQRKTITDYWMLRGYIFIDSYSILCPDSQDIVLQGSGVSGDSQLIEFDLEYCFENSAPQDCPTEEQIEENIELDKFSFLLQMQYKQLNMKNDT